MCADLIFSTDVTNTVIEPGDQGLDLEGDAGVDVNTGARACVQSNRPFKTINPASNHAMNIVALINQSIIRSRSATAAFLAAVHPSLLPPLLHLLNPRRLPAPRGVPDACGQRHRRLGARLAGLL